MNKLVRACLFAGALALFALPAAAQPGRGDFFIVSSVDAGKQRILLKFPTEVTELMRVNADTRYFDERGKPIRLPDLRSGDTVFITVKGSGDQAVAATIRRGPMTLELLRERYLGKKPPATTR